jgi:Tfp pilus assembly PilM family ATPase
MAGRILGVEFSEESMKLVEIGYGRRLKVFNFAIIDNRAIDPERRVDQFNHTLQVRGFEAKDVVVAANGVQVEHRLLTLPPLSGRELRFVMQREAKNPAPAGVTESYWDFELLKSKEELGIKKRQILLVTSATNIVSDAQEFFGRTKLKLQKVTTVGDALRNLLKNVGFWNKDVVKSIVHFSTNSVHVLFIQEGTLLLCRDIPISYGDVDPDQQRERLMTEIKRSNLYFRQNFPQREVDEVLFSGEDEMIGALVSQAKEDLGIESNVLRFDDNLDPSSFKGDWDEFRFHIPSLSAAFGVAWHKTMDTGINLIPGKAGSKEGPPVYQKLIKVAAMVVLAVMLVSGLRYFFGGQGLRADQLDLDRKIAELEPSIQEGQAAAAERNLADTRESFIDRMAAGDPWEEALRSLSLLVPDTAAFEAVDISGGATNSMVVQGYLRGASGQPSAEFAEFFEQLQGLEHFSSVAMLAPLSVSYEDVGSGAGADATVMPEVSSVVRFEVRCLLQ